MREFRGDGGREANSNNSSKADPEFRVDWKGSSERENSNINNMRTDRKDAREHRGGAGVGAGGEGREVMMMGGGRRGESRSGGGVGGSGGDITSIATRERKSSSEDLLRVNSNIAQETGEVREGWGSRTFLKSSNSSSSIISQHQAAIAAATAAAATTTTSTHGGEEEGEIGEFNDDGGVSGSAAAAAAGGGGGGADPTTMRFEETKRKRDEPRGISTHNNISNNANNVIEREERPREKSDRRGGGGGGDLQVHISFIPPSQHREKDREKEREKSSDREKEKEPNNSNTTSSNSNKQKDKVGAKEKEESSAGLVKEKGGSTGNKESSDGDSNRRGGGEKDGSVVSEGFNSGNRRKEALGAAANPEEKDQNPATERVEKRGGVPLSIAAEHEHDSAAGTSSGAGVGAGKTSQQQQQQQQEDNSSKGGGGEVEVKLERGGGSGESKEQQTHEKHEKGAKIEPVEEEKEKGKRKLRDYDRAGGGAGGDDAANNYTNNADGEDYEREVVSSYGIQRKRLLRPRGHYQGSNTREVRPRFRLKDPEPKDSRASVAAENSTLVYRAGEGLQEELRRIRREFEDRNGKLPAEQQNAQGGVAVSGPAAPTIEVRIPAELATTSNRQVQGSQLWGTDVYTDDSDLVAILMHTGYYAPTSSSPANSGISELRATVRVLAPQERYTSTLRNSLRSRAWGAASGCAFSVESCYLLKKDGAKVQLEPRLTFTPAFAPTLAPAVTERTVTTRAVSMNAYRGLRFVQEVTIQYNLCNEPWLKYSMNIVADKGLKKSQYTSARLKKNDVLYVETHSHRYELSYEDTKTAVSPVETKALVEKGKEKAEMSDKGLEKSVEKGPNQVVSSKEVVPAGNNHNNGPVVGDKYRWALCKWPLSLQSMRAKGVPLSLEFVKVLESGLGWEEVQWSPAGVCVRGKEYSLARAHFVPLHG